MAASETATRYSDLPESDRAPDKTLGITNTSGRGVYGSRRAVFVKPGCSSKTQIAALLDLLTMHLQEAPTSERVTPDEVVLLIEDPKPEALGAISTLTKSLPEVPSVDLRQLVNDQWVRAQSTWDPSDSATHPGWAGLLSAVEEPPTLVRDLIGMANLESLRAYPRLSTKAGWSLRLEGLEVARLTAKGGTLGVGRDGEVDPDGQPARSKPRKRWIQVTGLKDPLPLTDDQESRETAVRAILEFAADWFEAVRTAKPEQNEHALESRILRGAVTLNIDGTRLDLVQDDPHVNWGSQFPTKWGPEGRARYLDAVLRDGQIPWAIEMKIRGSGGVSQYYRHAVAQAVLYREFIKAAKDLYFWFERFGMDPLQCRGAVVVPVMTPSEQNWREQLQNLCYLFDISLNEVDPAAATLP